MKFFKNRKKTYSDIDPDEIFLDSRNAPSFDLHQMEGRFAQPIRKHIIVGLGAFFLIVLLVYGGRIWKLQVAEGDDYTRRSENNRLRHSLVFASRGVIYDRGGKELVWNEASREGESFARRIYTDAPGLAHVLGYVSYPQRDSSGIFFEKEYVGKAGVEKSLSDRVGGENGLQIVEINAHGEVVSRSELQPPNNGETLRLSIDKDIQSMLFESISNLAESRGFEGGAGVIMNIETGELLALVSYPEFDPGLLSEGADSGAIRRQVEDPHSPFLNRATDGLYTPGSIVKPFIALAALNEGVISPEKKIESTGAIRIPNPYREGEYTVFRDWRAHGWVDMRDALSVSSNEYFFTVGGGYGSQEGVGVSNIEKYARAFGVGQTTGIRELEDLEGVIPNPKWKAEHFEGEPWRLGDTYNTAIGQYGFQVTPLQMVRAVGAIATGGKLLTPTLLKDAPVRSSAVPIRIEESFYDVVREGMRQGVLEGTAQGLHTPAIAVAAKTGTAELGVAKQEVNSWVTGFFPYESPEYAFAVVMERGSRSNLVGATFVMRRVFEWMSLNSPHYFK